MPMKLHRALASKPVPSIPFRAALHKHGIRTFQTQRTVSGPIYWKGLSPWHLPSPGRRFLSAGPSTAPTQLVEEESVADESPDEFYPVYIGDIFQEKYKVVGKLGYGANSTIWLARDIQYVSQRFTYPDDYYYVLGLTRRLTQEQSLRCTENLHPKTSLAQGREPRNQNIRTLGEPLLNASWSDMYSGSL